eukprot:c28554_g1_i1 orf=74-238(+)
MKHCKQVGATIIPSDHTPWWPHPRECTPGPSTRPLQSASRVASRRLWETLFRVH